MTNRRKDGGEYIEEMTVAPVLDSNSSTTHFIAIKQDKSETIRLAQRAYHDGQLFRAVFHSA